MKAIVSTAAILTLAVGLSGTAFAGEGTPRSGPNSPTLEHGNPSNCVGAARASLNSKGGDRAQGGFGPIQSEFVKDNQPYGQWLQEWKEGCEPNGEEPS